MNPLKELKAYGQSVWLDYIRRSAINCGEIADFIEEDGVQGVTSNPAIFQKAIAGSSDYDEILQKLENERDRDAQELYEYLAIADIQAAADILSPIYRQTNKRDGYVSLEVSPYLAHQTEATISEARRLWQAVNRSNLMVKVPATAEGIPAIQQLISEGININVTLLFSQAAYQQVAEAYITGLEAYARKGGDIAQVQSVASFFISRIDTSVDARITEKIIFATSQADKARLKGLLGKVASSNAKLAYQYYQKIYREPRWQALANSGGMTQRLLWASTGNKNPNYSEVRYVEELIGEDTVNTIPPATLAVFRDRGIPRSSLTEDPEYARQILIKLEQAGISLDEITAGLLDKGVKLFAQAFDKLLASVERKREALLGDRLDRLSYSLTESLDSKVNQTLQEWQDEGKIRRLWAMDAALWSDEDENHWLGWLGIAEDQLAHIDHLQKLAREVKESNYLHAVLLGMGGSSLCPEVMRLTFGKIPGFPELHILDATDPAQIQALEAKIDLERTLFIVSSKSGSTLEPNIFHQYFWQRVRDLGVAEVGKHFIAVTDPDSHLEKIAQTNNFRHIYYSLPGIGGRYSALSDFGMVPAAVMGVDVAEFLDEAAEMVHSCAASVPATENPGVILGTILGVAANTGRDKVTLVCSPGIADLGAWLEQLLAESTGKQGKGLIPVAEEALGAPDVYGQDRLFVYIRLENEPEATQDDAVAALVKAGHPVVQIPLSSPYRLGQEFFRWEMATAVAGSIMGINAFNQPDVEASKEVTRQLTNKYEQTQQLPTQQPIYQEAGIKLYTDWQNAAELQHKLTGEASLTEYLRAHLHRIKPGDYVALLAYLDRNSEYQQKLQSARQTIRDRQQIATCLGFGPRFLHSTGQAYKGGANTGVFLQITCDDAVKLPIPEHEYDFSLVKEAQARGDFQVLVERDRRALRIHLSEDVSAGLDKVQQAISDALV